MSDTIDRMRRVFDEALNLAERKNHDYGDAWRDQGWRGNLSRVFEKSKRLRTLLWNGRAEAAQVRENVRETAIDQINTLAFFIMNHDAGVEWGDETPYPPVLFAPTEHGDLDYGFDPGIQNAVITGLQDSIQTGAIDDLPIRDPGAALVAPAEKPSPAKRNTAPRKVQ